jgi:hypothetical protein
VWLSQWYKLWV